MENLSDKQIKDRIRYLSDKMESLWEKISPDLEEFSLCEKEFFDLYFEFEKRGLSNNVKKQSTVNNDENSE